MHDNILQPVGNRQFNQPSFPMYSPMEDLFPRKTSAVVQPMPVQPVTNTPEKENVPLKPISISPVLPGTGSVTHNITRMLEDTTYQKRGQLPTSATRATHFSPYSTSHFLSFRHKILQDNNNRHNRLEDDNIDVGNDSHDHLRTGDIPNSSISTQGSASPQSTGTSSSPSGSSNASPESNANRVISPVVSPESSDEQPKKKARTNYTNEQVQALLKIFHENPYPDSEMMETIGKDLGIPENKIKIWFQNKRARWRRRVNDVNNYPQPFLPVPPMLSPVAPYGFMPTGHMMTSSPPQHFPGYFNYPWMQGSLSPNNNQQLPSQMSNSIGHSRLHPTNQSAPLQNQYFPTVSAAPSASTMSSVSPYGLKTSPQQMMTQQYNRSSLQFPFLYQSTYGASSYGQNQQ